MKGWMPPLVCWHSKEKPVEAEKAERNNVLRGPKRAILAQLKQLSSAQLKQLSSAKIKPNQSEELVKYSRGEEDSSRARVLAEEKTRKQKTKKE